MIFMSFAEEHTQFYKAQFTKSDIVTCLEKTNSIEIKQLASKHRMRLPTSLAQKRELCLIADMLNKKIILLDYEGYYLDSIGRGASDMYLYCLCFSRFDEDITDSTALGYPKALDN
jgi:hypothetical protein